MATTGPQDHVSVWGWSSESNQCLRVLGSINLQLHLVGLSDLHQCSTQLQLGTMTLFTATLSLWWKKPALGHITGRHADQRHRQRGTWLSAWAQTMEASSWTYCTQWRPFVAHEKHIEALHVFPPSPPPLHGRLSVHEGAVQQMPRGCAWQPCLQQLHLSLKGIGHRCWDVRQDKLWSKRWKIWGRACCLSWGLW